jgi:hypothetical protein
MKLAALALLFITLQYVAGSPLERHYSTSNLQDFAAGLVAGLAKDSSDACITDANKALTDA